MEGGIGVTRSIIDELHCWHIGENQKECESGDNGSIINDLLSSDIQGDQMEGKSDVTPSIIDELHCWVIQEDQNEG